MAQEEMPSMAPVPEEEAQPKRPKDPSFPFTLIMVAGVMSLINGILVLSLNTSHVEMVQFEGGDVDRALELLQWAGIFEIATGALVVVLGLVARLKFPSVGYAGAVVAVLSLGPLLLSAILGVIAFVLIVKYGGAGPSEADA